MFWQFPHVPTIWQIVAQNVRLVNMQWNNNQYLLTNSIGVFFPIEGFYLKGYYPTKLGEFLSSGIPVFTNTINKDIKVKKQTKPY